MTADWPQIDSTVSLQASNDLFGGDFFGDELNDMYISGASDIATLQEPSVPDKSHVPSSAPAPANDIDPTLDSIAFNDFTDLMPPEVASASPVPSAGVNVADESVTRVDATNSVSQIPSTTAKTSNTALTNTKNPQGKNLNCTNSTKPTKRGANQISAVATNKQQMKGSNANINGTSLSNGDNTMNVNSNHKENVPTDEKKGKGKKNAQTPNPLSRGEVNGVISPLSAPGAVASPLPAPVAFVGAPNQVTSGVAVNTGQKQSNSKAAATKATSAPAPVSRITTKSTRKTSNTTIYAPSRQMCTPSNITSKSSIKNMAANGRSSHRSNAIATAAAAASASPPDSSDFAAVAQAAVTNLMLNAGSHASQILAQKNHVVSDDSDSDPSTGQQRKIDTSTAHVTALTSPNWVAACASMTSTIPGTSVTAPIVSSSNLPALEISTTTSNADDHEDTPAAKRRRQNLNPEERAKQNRDRNREHARNTRLRKKAYVEELKRTLTELVAQRDANELEKRRNQQRELEQREVRFRVMEEFLKLRGSNEPNVARWVAILEDGFTLTLPFTTYRSVVKGVDANAKLTRQQEPQGQLNNHSIATSEDKQVLYGAPECMADATAVSGMLTNWNKGNKIGLHYECDRKRFLMDGTNAVLEWNAKSVNHDGSTHIFKISGSMRASFSPASNKLISCELCFDTGPVVSQLRKQQYPITYPIHDDFAANIFGGTGNSSDADRLLDSLEMPMLPGQSCTQSTAPTQSLNRGISQKSIVSAEHD